LGQPVHKSGPGNDAATRNRCFSKAIAVKPAANSDNLNLRERHNRKERVL
jgi:hypothetical protein